MITIEDILETNRMITQNKLDVRTITMGISLRDCAHPNLRDFCRNVYDKITKSAEFLVKTGEEIEAEYGVPIINKRISVTPIAIVAESCKAESYVPIAETLDRAAKEVGVNSLVRVSPHTCRHTFAHQELKNGLDLYSLSRLLGHESVSITQRYLEAVRDEQVLTSAKKTGVLAHL